MYFTGRYAEDYYEQIASEIEAGNLESLNQVASTTHVYTCTCLCNIIHVEPLSIKIFLSVLSMTSNSNLKLQTSLKVTTVNFGHRNVHGTCEIDSVYLQIVTCTFV